MFTSGRGIGSVPNLFLYVNLKKKKNRQSVLEVFSINYDIFINLSRQSLYNSTYFNSLTTLFFILPTVQNLKIQKFMTEYNEQKGNHIQ